MASTTTVKRALAALAAGQGFVPSDTETDDPARIVAEAETALGRLDTAADVLADGGERRLRQAVEHAEQRDRRRLARRGQRVLATLGRFRAVASDTDGSTGGRHSRNQPTENVKRGGDQPPDR